MMKSSSAKPAIAKHMNMIARRLSIKCSIYEMGSAS
jgi:hypothetical protein